MPNVENFNKLRAFLRENPKSLDMACWLEFDAPTVCGTVGCLGGLANYLERQEVSSDFDIETAVRWLGIDEDCANQLFFPYPLKRWSLITADEAIIALDNAERATTPSEYTQIWSHVTQKDLNARLYP